MKCFGRHVQTYLTLAACVVLCSCGAGTAPQGRGAGGPEIVDGGVIFRYYDRDAKRVHVVGDFNNWSPRIDPMTDENGDGEWTLLVTLGPGEYEYKFVVDGTKWIADPTNPRAVPDGFDGQNSVLVVKK